MASFKNDVQGFLHDANKFYKYIIGITDEIGAPKFECLGKFAFQVLSLPTCNADAERLFSKLNLIKRIEINCLKIETVKSLIQISESWDEKFKDYEPPQDIVNIIRNKLKKFVIIIVTIIEYCDMTSYIFSYIIRNVLFL